MCVSVCLKNTARKPPLAICLSSTHSYGDETLEAFFTKAVREGLKGQELGDQAVFGVNKE